MSIVFVLFLSSISCDYELPSDVNYVDVKPDLDPPPMIIDVDFEGDTIYVCQPNTILNFEPKIEGKEIVLNIFYLNDVEIKRYLDDTKLPLNILLFTKGVYGQFVLRLDSYVASGTGSIADKMGAEGFIYSKEWFVKTFNFNNIYISSLRNIQGRLKLEWDQYLGQEFVEYIVSKSYNGGFFFNSDTIRNKYQNFYYDMNYVGEKAYYKLQYIILKDGRRASLNSSGYTCQYPLPEPSIEKLKGLDAQLTFGRNQFFNNLAYYLLDINGKTQKLENINDTNITLKQLLFATNNSIKVYHFPKDSNKYMDPKNFLAGEANIVMGETDSIKGKFFVPEGDYYYRYPGQLVKIRKSDEQIVNKYTVLSGTFKHISSNGKYGVALASKNVVDLYDMENFQRIKSIDIKPLIWDLTAYMDVQVANNGDFLVSYFFTDKNDFSFALINHSTKDVIFHKNIKEYKKYTLLMSANAKYYLYLDETKTKVFELINDELTEKADLYSFGSISRAEFSLEDDEKIFLTYGEHVRLMNLDNQTIVFDYYCKKGYFKNIDYQNNRILIYDNTYFLKIVNLETGTIEKEIYGYGPSNIFLLNDYLYYNDNTNYYKLNLNDIE